MAYQLTATDLGTTPIGIAITISGSGGNGVFVSVFRSDATGVLLPETSLYFDDDGTQNVPVSGGLYLISAWNVDAGELMTPIYVMATNGLDAVQTRNRACIKARIEALGLNFAGGVVEQWTPDKLNLKFPCVLLTHEGTIETNTQRVVGTSDVGRPVRIMICDQVNSRNQAKMRVYDSWRQAIWRGMDNQRLPGLPESMKVEIEPDVISNPQSPKYQFMVSELIARVTCREPAYNGA